MECLRIGGRLRGWDPLANLSTTLLAASSHTAIYQYLPPALENIERAPAELLVAGIGRRLAIRGARPPIDHSLERQVWEQLGLGEFWREKLPPSREGTRWEKVLQTLVLYRLIDPGSEWRLHRHWFDHTAIADLLGGDFSLAEIHRLYECHDKLVAHKTALFDHLTARWRDLFDAKYEVLLYDLTSTYFESDPPADPAGLRRFGYSRPVRSADDGTRGDCVQVVIALIVTPEGFPIAYEVLAGNTTDKTTLKDFLAKIENQYGKAQRIWVMDRGIPTEETLLQMRESDPPVSYLVGTPKGKLTVLEAALEAALAGRDWQQARPSVRVKLLAQEGETYVLAQSQDRIAKERAMRRRRLRAYLDRLAALKARKRPLHRDAMHQALGAARKDAGRDARHVKVQVHLQGKGKAQRATLSWSLDRHSLREAWRREGRYLLRTNLSETDPAKLWEPSVARSPAAGCPQGERSEAILPPTHRSRTSLQRTQRRPGPAPHPPPTRTPHPCPHLHILPRLLPASDPQGPAQTHRQRADPARRARKVRRRANARRPPGACPQPHRF